MNGEKTAYFTNHVVLKKIIYIVSFAISILVRCVNIGSGITGRHVFRQTQVAIVIQNYLREGWRIDYCIPVFGPPWKVLFEFPTYQTIVYLLLKVLNSTNIDLVSRVFSIIIFYISAYFLFRLSKLYFDVDKSIFVCLIYVFMPFNIYWSRTTMIDYFSVMFALSYLYFMILWIRFPRFYYGILTVLLGTFGYLTKSTTMIPYVLAAACLIMYELETKFELRARIKTNIWLFANQNLKFLLELMCLCCIPVIPGVAWVRYADHVNEQGEFSKLLSSSALKEWNFGTIRQRLLWDTWDVIITRLLMFVGGYLGLIVLFIFIKNIKEKITLYWVFISITSSILTVALITNLYYVHDYYLMALAPLICMAIGIIIYESNIEKGISWYSVVGIFLWVLLVMNNTNEYFSYVHENIGEVNQKYSLIQNITSDDEYIYICGEDWSSETLYRCDRKGYMDKFASYADVSDMIKSNNFTTFTSPVINDDIREICKDYRYITQYGGWGFVYKFENDLKEDLSKNDKYSVTHDLEFEGEYYLPIIIEMDDGAVYKDEIVLFSEREEIYYVPYQDSKKIVEIRIDNDEIDGDFDNNIKITHL